MSEAITIRNNFPNVAATLNRIGVEAGNRAMIRALNRTVDQGKVQMAKQISREFMLTSAKVKERLSVVRATAKGTLRFQARLKATRRNKGRSMNLIAFMEKKISLAQAKKRAKAGTLNQLQFQIKRAGGKKQIPGAFIANKGRTVFIREGKGRYPIRALNTIDVPQMFNTRRINKVVRAAIIQRFESNFKRELRAVLKGYAR